VTLLVVAGVMLAAAAPGVALPTASPQCTPAPADCSGWFRSDVTLSWAVDPVTAITAGCENETFTSDTAGAVASCSAEDDTGTATSDVTIRRDATPPEVGASQVRPADADGWYNQPFTIAVSGQDATSGLASCAPVTYQGPDTAAGSVVGTCIDVAGNVGSSAPLAFRYDATGPDVTAAVPARPPDRAGWYSAPISFSFLGADATSGLAACVLVSYSGPDSSSASVVGTCRDNAGNVSHRAFGFMFDATPPPISGLRTVSGDRRVAVRWTTSQDATSVEVVRIPGLGSSLASVVFRGPGSSFEDDEVVNGVSYVYRVRLSDAAGNDSSDTVAATPRLPSADPTPGGGAPACGSAPGLGPPQRSPALPAGQRRGESEAAAAPAMDAHQARALLQRPALPRDPQGPERLAGAAALPAQAALVVRREASPADARTIRVVRVAGLRSAFAGQLRRSPRAPRAPGGALSSR
jgi:hypothetical protein